MIAETSAPGGAVWIRSVLEPLGYVVHGDEDSYSASVECNGMVGDAECTGRCTMRVTSSARGEDAANAVIECAEKCFSGEAHRQNHAYCVRPVR